jgi:hypothetical protein
MKIMRKLGNGFRFIGAFVLGLSAVVAILYYLTFRNEEA